MEVAQNKRQSRRLHGNKPVEIIEIGDGNIPVTDLALQGIIKNKIKIDVPQIVSLPVPPARHAFLVHINKKEKKIMISDWGGKSNKTIGITVGKRKALENWSEGRRPSTTNSKGRFTPGAVWQQYSNFMILLEEKYKLPIEYYEVDKELKKEAEEHHSAYKNKKEQEGSGGCSYYIFKWLEKYYN